VIRPTKYLKIEQCVLRVAALLLYEVRTVLAVPFPELDSLVSTRLGDAARANLNTAINLLYLMGLVEYNDATDTLIYIEVENRSTV